MNQAIKKRIEDINNGIVPEGYKQTPFGIFPYDWETASIGEVSINKGEYGLNAPACEYESGLPKYIRITDIDDNGNYVDTGACVDFQDVTKQYTLKDGDVVFARTGATVGRNYLYKEKDGKLLYAGFLIKFSINKNVANPYIIYANSNTKQYWNWIKKISARSGQPGVNAEEYSQYRFVKAKDKTEQSKIAEILMKWDEMVELQEQYIQKLELRKKAYIDKFFTEKSCNCVFKDLYVQAGEGGTPDTKKVEYYENGNIPFVKIEHLYKKYIEEIDSFITEEGLKKSGAWLVPKNSLIFSNGATIGECSINRIPVTTKQGILGIVPSGRIELEYFYYLLKSEYFFKKITTKGTMCTAYLKDIDKLKLYTHSKVEQSAISKLLGKVDEEISLQKEKLEKIKIQRKAMQQYLLTGIVRV